MTACRRTRKRPSTGGGRAAKRTIIALAALGIGFAAGNGLAEPLRLRFERATLWQAMSKAHAVTQCNVIGLKTSDDEKAVDVAVSTRADTAQRVAHAFGYDYLQHGTVGVLAPALPGGKASERIHAGIDWATETCGSLSAPGTAMSRKARSLRDELGRGAWNFGDLPKNQQDRLLDLFRERETVGAANNLNSIYNLDKGISRLTPP